MSKIDTNNSYWADKKKITLTNEQLSKLARVQKSKHLAWGIFLSGFPVFVFAAVLSEYTFFAPLLALLYIPVFVFGAVNLGTQKCPFCHNNFFWGLKNPLANKCVHCGLNLYQTQSNTHVYKGYAKQNENINTA